MSNRGVNPVIVKLTLERILDGVVCIGDINTNREGWEGVLGVAESL